jgi:hypothetical protein
MGVKACAACVLVLVAVAATSCAAPKIAIFDEPDFPCYMAASTDGSRLFQDLYQAMGLQADLVSARELGDPAAFNARKYAAYVHVYGNTFPVDAFPNLVQFHRDGGCILVPSGVPFCHPTGQTGAAGWPMDAAGSGGRVMGDAHSGAAAFRIRNVGQWTGPGSPRFAVKPGEKFVVAGWAKIGKKLGAHENSRIFLRLWNAGGTFIGQDGPGMPTEPCDWTRIEKAVVVPDGAATADVSPQLWAPDGEIMLDDLFLARGGEEEKNLLGNPSFEEASGGWADLGHVQKYMTHSEGIGIGEFYGIEKPGGFAVAPFGEKIGLSLTKWDALPEPDMVQTLDPHSLPAEDEVRPIVRVGEAAKNLSPAVMIVHHCREFNGAVDVWGRGNCPPIRGTALYEIATKATVAALREKGVVTAAEAKTMIARADEMLKAEAKRRTPVTEKRPFDTVWPHSKKPAATVAVCDVSEAGAEEEFALTVLQGLVNRQQPRLYLLHSRYAKQDKMWLEELKVEGIKAEEISREEAWKRYGGAAKGAVVYDRAALKEIGAFRADKLNVTNIVMMVCAVNDAVPVALDAGQAPKAGLAVVMDTRGKWATPYEMYQWAYDNLWAKMNHHVLGTMYPGIFYLTDYLVENRIFTFWFGASRTYREQTLLERVLGSTPPNTPILGWWFDWMPNVQDSAHPAADCIGEGDGVEIGSRYGKFLTVTHEATNLSVHSGMPLLGIKHKPVAAPARLDRTKVYFSFMISDGDNLGECLMMRCRDLHWDQPERGQAPMGWSFAPATEVLAPTVVNYYLRTATENDLLVGGLGIGYTHPDAYGTAYPEQRESIFAEYARRTAESLPPLDTGALWLIGGSRENISRYAAAGRPLRTIFPDYGWGAKRPYGEVTYMDKGDVAVFRAVTGWGDNENYVDRLVRDIRAAAEGVRPAFLHVFLLNWGFRLPMMRQVIEKLGDEYVPVRPDELDRLYREAVR